MANARPGGGLVRMADSHPEIFPAIIRTRILVPAEQGNQVKFLDTWKSCSGQTDQTKERISLVAVFTKYCFRADRLHAVKTGHWKGCSGPERRLKQCVGATRKHLNV